MQLAVVEFARNVLNIVDAHSREFAPDGDNCVIELMDEQQQVTKMGGTMRLGALSLYDKRRDHCRADLQKIGNLRTSSTSL